jgi:hypothetical protein
MRAGASWHLRAMLNGEISFHEGAAQMNELRRRVGSVDDLDEEFEVFVLIGSEADWLAP